jgi:hypothetical protein
MVFAQRLALRFKMRDTKIIAIGISMSSANTSNSPCVIGTPPGPSTPCNAPGWMKPTMSAKAMLNMTTIQSVEILVPISFITATLLIV